MNNLEITLDATNQDRITEKTFWYFNNCVSRYLLDSLEGFVLFNLEADWSDLLQLIELYRTVLCSSFALYGDDRKISTRISPILFR